MAPSLPFRTRELLDRAERGDREACFDLARLLRPVTFDELVRFVRPDGLVKTSLFDALADAYDAYRSYATRR